LSLKNPPAISAFQLHETTNPTNYYEKKLSLVHSTREKMTQPLLQLSPYLTPPIVCQEKYEVSKYPST